MNSKILFLVFIFMYISISSSKINFNLPIDVIKDSIGKLGDKIGSIKVSGSEGQLHSKSNNQIKEHHDRFKNELKSLGYNELDEIGPFNIDGHCHSCYNDVILHTHNKCIELCNNLAQKIKNQNPGKTIRAIAIPINFEHKRWKTLSNERHAQFNGQCECTIGGKDGSNLKIDL